MKSLPPDALELIHSLQPYRVSPREPEFHPLWLLNDLDIWDKHKQLAMRQVIPGVMFVRMTKSTGETVHQRIPLAASVKRGQFIPFEDGAHLCTVETLVGPRSGPFEVDLSIVKVEVSVSVE